MKLLTALFLTTLPFLASCVNTSNLTPSKPVEISSNEAVVILGVAPSYQVSFKLGTVENESWSIDNFALSATSNFPENDYIVVKVPALKGLERYGLAQIQPTGLKGRGFIPCKGNKVIVFEAPAGRVTYIGDISYEMETPKSKKISYSYSSNPNKARRFLVENYPELAAQMEIQESKELIVAESECEVGSYLFIGGVMTHFSGQRRNSADPLRTYPAR